MKKRGLGKGLDALLGGDNATPAKSDIQQFPLSNLESGEFQPRKHFSKEELKTLADSVRQHGVIQPIIIRPLKGNKYEIVAGERRYRASKLVGLKTIPAVVRQLSNKEAQIFALIENLQRSDLNPIEQAQSLERLISELNITHAKAGESVGLSRPAVSNLLRLLDLNPEVQQMLIDGKLEMGHARPLLSLPSFEQIRIAQIAYERKLTTRELEALIKKKNKEQKPNIEITDPDTQRLEKKLSKNLSMRVTITHKKSGQGEVRIYYGSLDSLDTLIEKLKS